MIDEEKKVIALSKADREVLDTVAKDSVTAVQINAANKVLGRSDKLKAIEDKITEFINSEVSLDIDRDSKLIIKRYLDKVNSDTLRDLDYDEEADRSLDRFLKVMTGSKMLADIESKKMTTLQGFMKLLVEIDKSDSSKAKPSQNINVNTFVAPAEKTPWENILGQIRASSDAVLKKPPIDSV